MYVLIGSLLAGLLLGACSGRAVLMRGLSARMTTAGMIFLLFCMGASLATDPKVISQLQWIGLQAFFHALCATAGSVLAVWGIECWLDRNRKDR